MLRVTIELLPKGNAASARHMGTLTIANDGTGSEALGNYNVTLSKWGRPAETWREGHVQSFPRQGRGPFDLLLWALIVTVGKRNSGART